MEYHTKYYLLESGRLLACANRFRDDHIHAHHEAEKYIKSIGADGYSVGLDNKLNAVRFPGEIPKGFTKPNKYGASSPYKRSAYADVFKTHIFPNDSDYIEDILEVPTGLSYYGEDESIRGFTAIGHPFKPYGFYWYAQKGPILFQVPDVAHYVKEVIDEVEEPITFGDGVDTWKMDEPGAKEILPERWELMRAEYELEKA